LLAMMASCTLVFQPSFPLETAHPRTMSKSTRRFARMRKHAQRLVKMALVLGPSAALKLDSRCENQIDNLTVRAGPIHGELLAVEDYKKMFPQAIHRTGPSRRYNCHGLVFASRRTAIIDSAVLATMLREDDYQEIPLAEVMPGDVAIYWDDGDMQHSGLVVEVSKNPTVPRILSKWAHLQEAVHWVHQAPPEYGADIHYYRIRA
jgi:hypothetical protein